MAEKKILIVSRSFYPNNSPRSFRTTELARELARQGNKIVVYTVTDGIEYSAIEKEFGLIIKDLGPLKFKPLKVRGKIIQRTAKKAIQSALRLFLEYPEIELFYRIPSSLKLERGYDLLISVASPHPIHWGTARAIKKNPEIADMWIADCGDPYMGATLETIKKPFYFRYFEKYFCRKADYISVPTEGAVLAYYPEFRSKIRVIPQGFSFESLKVLSGNVSNDIISFAYAGSIASKGVRDPKPFLNYIAKQNKDFRFHVFSVYSGEILAQFKSVLGERLVIHKNIDRESLIYELSKMDFLVNFDNGTNRQTPSKLIDYSLAGRPILNFYPLNPNFDTVDQFLNRDYNNKFQVKDIQQYNVVNVANKFLKLSEKE